MADVPFLTYAFEASGAPTPRTYPDRLNDVINVKDFGATGDGSTDDSNAIQTAINYAYTLHHGTILFFPPGTYRIGTTLDLAPVIGDASTSIVLVGSGRDATILRGSITTGNPPWGYQDFGSGTMSTARFLPPGAILSSTWNAQNFAGMHDMTIWNESTANVWDIAVVLGSFQSGGVFQNCRFKGMSGMAITSSFGLALRHCIAESIQSQPTADTAGTVTGAGGGPDPVTALVNFTYPFSVPTGQPSTYLTYSGSAGFYLQQGDCSGLHVIGPFDLGFGWDSYATSMVGCTVSRCGIGFAPGMGAAFNISTHTAVTAGNMAGCSADRCFIGMYDAHISLTGVTGNCFTGSMGPADPATISTMNYNSRTHVVTVSTVNNHNIPDAHKVYLSVPSDWLPAGSTGIVVATTTGGGLTSKQFTYPGPSSKPTSAPVGSWNYPIQYGILHSGANGNIRLAANSLSANASVASFAMGTALCHNSEVMATTGPSGWLLNPTWVSGLSFISCGTTGTSNGLANNPLVPVMNFLNLPNNRQADINSMPSQPLIEGQKFWILDATTGSLGDTVGVLLTTTAQTLSGNDTLTFASVPAFVTAGMHVWDGSQGGNSANFPMADVQSVIGGNQIKLAHTLGFTVNVNDVIAVGGHGPHKYLVRFDGTNWTRVA